MLKQITRQAFTALYFFALFSAKPSLASSIQAIEFDDMARSAQAIVEAEVVAVKSQWNPSRNRIHTYIDFKIQDVIKGTFQQDTFQLRFLGGSVGEDTLQVAGLVYPRLGERGIYFIESLERNQVNPLLGWSQGHYTVGVDGLVRSNQDLSLSVSAEPIAQKHSSGAHGLSNGVAKGLHVRSKQQSANGLSKSNFKRMVRTSLEK